MVLEDRARRAVERWPRLGFEVTWRWPWPREAARRGRKGGREGPGRLLDGSEVGVVGKIRREEGGTWGGGALFAKGKGR